MLRALLLGYALLCYLAFLAGTLLEERDLLRTLGADYAVYRRQVPRFFPVPWRRAGKSRSPRGSP